MATANMRVSFDEESLAAMKGFGDKLEKALKALSAVPTHTTEPMEPGFYAYTGGRQTMVFLLDHSQQWYTVFDNGIMEPCRWGYIEQSLSVYELVRIDNLMGGF